MVKATGARGHSLMEILVVMIVIGVLATVAPRLLIQVNQFFIFSWVKADLQREGRAAMYLINRDLHQALSNTIRIDQAGGQPYYSRIAFTKIQGTGMTFYQNGTNLMMTDGGNPAKRLSTSLRYLAFSFPRSNDLTIVSVSLTLEKNIYRANKKALHMASEKVRVMN